MRRNHVVLTTSMFWYFSVDNDFKSICIEIHSVLKITVYAFGDWFRSLQGLSDASWRLLGGPWGVFWRLRVLLDKNMQKLRSQPILQGGSKKVIFVYAKKTLIFTVPLGFCRENQKNASQNNCPAACLLDNYQVKSLKSLQDHHQSQAWGGWIIKLPSDCPATCLLDNFR